MAAFLTMCSNLSFSAAIFCFVLVLRTVLTDAQKDVNDVTDSRSNMSLSGNHADAVLFAGLKQTIQDAEKNSADRVGRLPNFLSNSGNRAKQCGIPGAGGLNGFNLGNKIVIEDTTHNEFPTANETDHQDQDAVEDVTFPSLLDANMTATMATVNRFMKQFLRNREPYTDNIVPRRKRAISHKRLMVAPTIVGGFDAVPNQICWQVKLTISMSGGTASCGGTIIGPRTILTAAHCTLNPFIQDSKEQFNAEDIVVQVGAMTRSFSQFNPGADKTGCAENYKVSRVITHADYDTNLGNNDIGMLILTRPIDFKKSCACPLCLRNKSPSIGEMCVVSGTGDEGSGGSGNRFPVPLKWVRVNVLQQSTQGTCAFSRNSEGTATDLDKFICAGDVIGEDSCQGDSGGPLFCFDRGTQSYYLAGVVSFGDSCASGVGGQYTKVQRYINWISAFSDLQ